jgi:predicted transcriptional regulator
MITTTIRVSLRVRDLLQELAQASGSSTQIVLEQALEWYRRQQLLEATNTAYAALRAAPEAWAQQPAFSANNLPAHARETGRKSSPGAGVRVGAGVKSAR